MARKLARLLPEPHTYEDISSFSSFPEVRDYVTGLYSSGRIQGLAVQSRQEQGANMVPRVWPLPNRETLDAVLGSASQLLTGYRHFDVVVCETPRVPDQETTTVHPMMAMVIYGPAYRRASA